MKNQIKYYEQQFPQLKKQILENPIEVLNNYTTDDISHPDRISNYSHGKRVSHVMMIIRMLNMHLQHNDDSKNVKYASTT